MRAALLAALALAAPPSVAFRVQTGGGAGVPAVGATAVWVPNTKAGTVSRVDVRRRRIVATIKLGAPVFGGGFLDSAVVAGRSVSAATGAERVLNVDGAFGTGIGYGGDAVWLLTSGATALLELDPGTGAVRARVPIDVPPTPKHAVIESWWVAAGAGSLWVAQANYDRVVRVDAAAAKVTAAIPVRVAAPFGVAFHRGAVWVSGSGKVARIDPGDEPGRAAGYARRGIGPGLHTGRRRTVRSLGDRLRQGSAVPAARAVASARELGRAVRAQPPVRRLPRRAPRPPGGDPL